jgi:serine/threonine protein kinase
MANDFQNMHRNGGLDPFYVMTLYSKTLRSLMREEPAPHKKLRYIEQVIAGLAFAHQHNISHRDIKPENILYDTQSDCCMLSDFGAAHMPEDVAITDVDTSSGERLANFRYAAPEQREPGGKGDQRSDVFSLGLILNEMFTGKLAVGEDYLRIGSLNPIFKPLDELIESMLQQDPDSRPQSAIEVIERFASVAGLVVQALEGELYRRSGGADPISIGRDLLIESDREGFHPIYQPSRVTKIAVPLAAYLNRTSELGIETDPSVTIKQIEDVGILDPSALEEAVDELQHGGLITFVSVMDGGGGGSTVRTSSALFWYLDYFFQGNDPRRDAAFVIGIVKDRKQESYDVAELARELNWLPRRMNPALTYMKTRDLINAAAPALPYAAISFFVLPRGLRFARL